LELIALTMSSESSGQSIWPTDGRWRRIT
jgi:hypothetical protein